MGVMSTLLGGSSEKTPDDYVELDFDEKTANEENAGRQVHVAEIRGQASTLDVKDAVAAGDIVIADITYLNTQETSSHIIGDLERTAKEVGGDIVQLGDDRLIITPGGIHISREKLGE